MTFRHTRIFMNIASFKRARKIFQYYIKYRYKSLPVSQSKSIKRNFIKAVPSLNLILKWGFPLQMVFQYFHF